MSEIRHDKRIPRSGNAALAAGALIQLVLGIEFLLSGLSKLVDPNYVKDFAVFLLSSPGAQRGPIAVPVRWLVSPHVTVAAPLALALELLAGLALLVAGVETARRRFSGKLGAQQGYEPYVALAGATAAALVSGLSLGIYLIKGGGLPVVNPTRAFASALQVELLLVPLGLAMAWLELGRFFALRHARRLPPVDKRLAA